MASVISSVASLLSAISWPLIVGTFLFFCRKEVRLLLSVVTGKIRDAGRVRIAGFEVEALRGEMKAIVRTAEISANTDNLSRNIPSQQFEAARMVAATFKRAKLSQPEIRRTLQPQVSDLAEEYDTIRIKMPRGAERTRRMNELAAALRALAPAVAPLLPDLMHSFSPGKRLAAICHIQMRPQSSYFRWLIERFKVEDQAFILFHAALAVYQCIEKRSFADATQTLEAIDGAITTVNSFSGGTPDQGTLEVLSEAASKLQAKIDRVGTAH